MLPIELLKAEASTFGVELTDEQLQQFNTYCNFLIEYNQKVNLTAITDPAEIAIKHFVDSIAPLRFVVLPQDALLIDVGTGAGFPGVPLKLVRPDLRLTLLDSLQKRLTFLEQLGQKLGVDSRLVHSRAEQAGADPALRERFDIATSRAVASLAALCEYNLPLLKVGGKMLALKGPDCQDELNAAQNSIRLLGGKLLQATEYEVGESRRTLIVVEKTAPTPKKYPRQRMKITEKPL